MGVGLLTADSGLLVLLEVVVHEAHHQRRLAHRRFAQEHELDARAGLRGLQSVCHLRLVYVVFSMRFLPVGPRCISSTGRFGGGWRSSLSSMMLWLLLCDDECLSKG